MEYRQLSLYAFLLTSIKFYPNLVGVWGVVWGVRIVGSLFFGLWGVMWGMEVVGSRAA